MKGERERNRKKTPRELLSNFFSAIVITNGIAILSDASALSYALGFLLGIVSLLYSGAIFRFPLEGEKPRTRIAFAVLLLICGILCLIGSINNFVNYL